MPQRNTPCTRGWISAALFSFLLTAACAPLAPGPAAPVEDVPSATTLPPGPAPPTAPDEPGPPPEVQPPPPVAPDAVAALIAEARMEASAGRLQAAAVLAERAQRLDPRAPEPYLVLARMRQADGQSGPARQLVIRGIAASRPGTPVRAELEALLRTLDP